MQGSRLGTAVEVPPSMRESLVALGIDLSMWSELQEVLGKSSCVGSPSSMSGFAERSGRHWASGHRVVAECFSG